MQVVKHMQLTQIMTITKKTITFALAVVFILGLMAKVAFGATYVLPVSQLDFSEFEPTCPSSNSPYLQYNFGQIEAHEVNLSGDFRYFTIWLKDLPSNAYKVDSLSGSSSYNLTGNYPNTPIYTTTGQMLTSGDLNNTNCRPYTVDFGDLIFNNGSMSLLLGVFDNANQRIGGYTVCGTHNRPANLGYMYQNYYYLSSGVCNSGSNYFDWVQWQYQFFPAFATELVLPLADISDVNITVAGDKTAKLTGNVSNYTGYNVVYVDIYDTATNTLVDGANAFGILNVGAFNLQLGALPAGAYTAHFTLTQLMSTTFLSLATTYDFVLSNPIPPSVSNPTGGQTPASIYATPVNPEDYRLINSDWTTGTALYTTITNAIYPVINAVGQWSQTFNGRFLTADAITSGQAIGGGISTITAYASNLNGFFGNLPIVQALFVFLVFNLALAVLASIRFIIKLIK